MAYFIIVIGWIGYLHTPLDIREAPGDSRKFSLKKKKKMQYIKW